MSKTNKVCVCCEARDNCPYYDTRRTVCVPVKCADWEDFSTIQDTTDWQHYRIQAAIEFAAQILANHGGATTSVAEDAVTYADALIEELKKGDHYGM